MKKPVSILIAVMMILTTVTAMCGCGSNQEELSAESPAASSSAGVFDGELVDAQNSRLVISGDDETMLFETGKGTVYDLKEESELCIGDQVEVDYRKDKDMFFAETVRLKEHENQPLIFGGAVTELKDSYLTVQSESQTVVFIYDKKTKITGDLSEGDSAIVTYEGNLSENPKAVGIAVVQEKKAEKEKSINGTVSEIGEKSIIVSVDSAHACRFQITAQTTIGGDDSRLKLGDEVHLVYTGSAGSEPVAKSITIKRKQGQQYYVMDGVIDQVSSNSIIVKTAKKNYTFGIKKETRIQNPDYMKAGHMTTITYSGNLDQNPVAASIFCSKDTFEMVSSQNDGNKTKTGDTAKAGEKKDTAEKSGTKETAKDSGKTDAAKDSGTKDTAKDSGKTDTDKDSGTKDTAKDSDKTDTDKESGTKDTAKSSDKTDTDTASGSAENVKTAESSKSDSTSDSVNPKEDQTAGDKDKKETGSSDKDTASSKSSDNEKAADQESVIIQARGELIKWDNPCMVKIDGRGTVTLDIINASVSGGYIPQDGDKVIISYEKSTMELTGIQLEYRPGSNTEQEKAQ